MRPEILDAVLAEEEFEGFGDFYQGEKDQRNCIQCACKEYKEVDVVCKVLIDEWGDHMKRPEIVDSRSGRNSIRWV